jgi:hypothetical protein
MIVSRYIAVLTLVAALGAFGFYAKSVAAEDAAPEQPAAEDTSASEPQSPRSPLRVKTVDYDDAGKLKLAGIALPNNELYVYFDDQPFATVVPDEAGNWSVEGDLKLDEGRHNIRAEQFDPETKMVAARAMISIERAKQPPDGAPKTP